jgi:hypothetical protein
MAATVLRWNRRIACIFFSPFDISKSVSPSTRRSKQLLSAAAIHAHSGRFRNAAAEAA